MITGSLQQKNGFYYAVLNLKVDGKRKPKWVPLHIPVEGTSTRKAQKAFDNIRYQFEVAAEEAKVAAMQEAIRQQNPEAEMPFAEYMEKWLETARPTIASTTYQSYSQLIKSRIKPYFTELGVSVRELSHKHIDAFYASILAENCTPNTVIHYRRYLRCGSDGSSEQRSESSQRTVNTRRPCKRSGHHHRCRFRCNAAQRPGQKEERLCFL